MLSRRCPPLFTIAIVLACTTMSSAIDKPDSVEVSGKIKWVYDYEEGKQLSEEMGRPMFVVFRCER